MQKLYIAAVLNPLDPRVPTLLVDQDDENGQYYRSKDVDPELARLRERVAELQSGISQAVQRLAEVTHLPKLWTKHEVAEYLGLNPETVARECRRGRLGHILIGNKTKFTDAHIEQYLRDRECAAGSQKERARPIGTSSSTTPAHESAGQLALALQIAAPRKKRSPSTSSSSPSKD